MHLNIFDKYAIKSFYSLLQYHTSAKVNIRKSLQKNTLFLDYCKYENAFISLFELKYDYLYTKKDLNNLVKLSAIF